MPRVRTATALAAVTAAMMLPPSAAQAQTTSRLSVPRVATARSGVPVFHGSQAAAGAQAVAAPAIPPMPTLDKIEMTALSLPGSDVHGAGATIHLAASRPVVPNGTMSVEGATTQPIFGQDGSVLFDDLGHRPAGTVRLRVRLTATDHPHVVDCATVAKPGVAWEMSVGPETQMIPPGSHAFTAQHLSAIVVPEQPGEFVITLRPKLVSPASGYVFTTLGYCDVTVLQ